MPILKLAIPTIGVGDTGRRRVFCFARSIEDVGDNKRGVARTVELEWVSHL